MRLLGLLSAGLLSVGVFAMHTGMQEPMAWNDDVSWRPDGALYTFRDAVDAVSLGVPQDTVNLLVSARLESGRWTDWEQLEIEKEFDPLLRETNLVLFPSAVHALKVRGTTQGYVVHPIRISHEPTHVEYAALQGGTPPKILSRRQWGADDELLYTDTEHPDNPRSDVDQQSADVVLGEPTGRIKECEEAQKAYPQEFKVARTVTTGDNGRTLRWDQQYSKKVTMIAVHHTAMQVTGDARAPEERMRALYQYHAVNRGWGDIGYHFVISEDGQIFEGKAGGSYVVGGHAYCNNIGTVGIALMGNFEVEQPTQMQMKALKWLINDLSDIYHIDLTKSVTYHGTTYASPVVGHGDLLSTSCPGYYVRETLAQVRKQVIAGDINATIVFPKIAKATPTKKPTSTMVRGSGKADGLRAAGSTVIRATPGARQRFSVMFTPPTGAKRRDRIADIARSNVGIGLFQDIGGVETRLSTALFTSESVRAGQSAQLSLMVQAPRTPGTYSFSVGSVLYTLTVARGGAKDIDAARRTYTPQTTPTSYRPEQERRLSPTAHTQPSTSSVTTSAVKMADHPIRILLTTKGPTELRVSGGTTIRLGIGANDTCHALIGTREAQDDVLTFSPEEFGVLSVADDAGIRSYRGSIECRVIDGAVVLINELPLEDYMLGLGEEPDTEPYEKQRAFAIAARTYALWYLNDANRKFPGKPYDGSDSPAEFQLYKGMQFERNNPSWVRAVKDTAKDVLTYKDALIKPPYFSSSDGRTRTPAEVGWKNFPFSEIFTSKSDPWCQGLTLRGHGVGMSGCGAKAQAEEGKTGEQILLYYYPGTQIESR